ncbi:hypothetical protein ABZ897_60610 [Nonomuraea sp. NPDC046802]|uniref:hypothetical protein n=1 Tax=Nonomuraea sp. NPDC046802 TaxID=3154919 RepID=UPI0033FE0502
MLTSDDHVVPTPARTTPPITILLDPDDAWQITADALAAHAPAHGRITVHPTPGITDDRVLAHDLLAALGKQATHLNVQHLTTSGAAWAAAATWMILGNTTTLILLRAHLMGAQRWKRLLWLREETGVHLVLIHHTGTVAHTTRARLADIEHRITRDHHECLPPPPPGTEQSHDHNHDRAPAHDEAAAPSPAMVDAPFPRYRAEAYRRLTAAEFAQADAEYRRGLQAACAWLTSRATCETSPAQQDALLPIQTERGFSVWGEATLVDHVLGRTRLQPSVDGADDGPQRYPYPWSDTIQLEVFLSELVLGAPTRAHSVARVRGAQAGFLLHGLLLQPPDDLVAAGGPGMSYPFTRDVADRIRSQLAHPYVTAALVIALLSGTGGQHVSEVDARKLDASASQFTLASGHYAIPGYCRDLVRAAGLYCRLAPGSRRLRAVIGEHGAALVPAAATCGIEWDNSSLLVNGGPWHVWTGCWRVGEPLHEWHDIPPRGTRHCPGQRP